MGDIEIFENERATNYDNFVQTWIPNYSFFLNQIPALLATAAKKDLLVAGCGTGNEMLVLAEASEGWQMTGVDPSPEMLAQAKKKLKHLERISLVAGEVKDFVMDASFGAATLLLVLHFLKDDGAKLNLLQDIAMRLQSGAPFVLLDITGSPEQMELNLQVLKHLLPEGLDRAQVEERILRIQNELHYVSEDRLAELLVAAGFEQPTRFFQTVIYQGWITKKTGT